MNKINYLLLCKNLNSLFRELSSREQILPCLQSINIIKENKQYYNNQYKLLNSKFFFIKIFFNFFTNLFRFLYSFLIVLFLNFLKKKKIYKKNNEIIFLSHGFSQNQKIDVYFDHIKKFYKKKNIFTIYINQTNTLKNLNSTENYIYGLNLNTKKLLSIFVSILNNFFYVFFKMFNSKIEKKNYLYLLSNILSSTSFYNFIIAHETIEFLKKSNVKYLFYTFEGFVFEKYLVSLLKRNKNIKVTSVGYQHTGLSLYNNSILKLSIKKYLPDYLLCVSNRDKKILSNNLKFKNVLNIGQKVQKIKLKNRVKNWKLKKDKVIKCLILFENNYLEINNFLNNLLSINRRIKITIRSHPLFEKNLHKIENLRELKLSDYKKNINKDFSSNNVIIYKSSSLVFEAIKYGLLPLKIKSLNFDENPLENIIKFNNITGLDFYKNLEKIIKNNQKKKIDYLIKKIYKNSNIYSLDKIK